MSKPNLPPVPKRIYAMSGIWNHAELDEAIQAYAEEAVRQALAAQVPVAWVMQVGMRQEFLPKSKVLLATSMGYQPKPLAIIPEKDHG